MSASSESPFLRWLTLLIALYGAGLATCTAYQQNKLTEGQRELEIASRMARVQTLLEVGEGRGPSGMTEDAARIEAAEHLVEELLALAEQDPKVRLLEGHIHFARGDVDEAAESYLHATEEDPSFAPGYMYLGLARLTGGDPEGAEEALQDALDCDPQRVAILTNLATVQMNLWKFDQALENLTTANELSPDNPAVQAALGNYRYEMGQTPLAVASYRRAVRLDPRDPLLFRNLGSILLAQGQLDEAEAALEQVVELDPNDLLARRLLADLHRTRGDSQQAVESNSTAEALTELLGQDAAENGPLNGAPETSRSVVQESAETPL